MITSEQGDIMDQSGQMYVAISQKPFDVLATQFEYNKFRLH